MIRHSSSFFISLMLHSFLAVILYFVFTDIVIPKVQEPQRTEIKLCSIVHTPKVEQKQVEIPKEIPQKIQKPKPKPKKTQQKVKKKVLPKKIVHVKEAPKIEEPEIVEEKVIVQEIDEEPTLVTTITESKPQKALRLESEYINKHLQEISKLLQNNLYYPRSARKRGITGKTLVRFKLSTNGSAHSITVKSSNSEILSRAAIKTIQNLSGKFPKPPEELVLNVPINYTLN